MSVTESFDMNKGVLSKNGQPVVFYHGTNSEFEFFDKSFLGSAGNGSVYGDSFNFTQIKSFAEDFGKFVVSAYLNVKNPVVLNPNRNLDIDTNLLQHQSDLASKPIMLKILRKLWTGKDTPSIQDDYLMSKLKSLSGFIDLLKGIAHRDKTSLSSLLRKFGFDSIIDGHIVAVFDTNQINIIGRENSSNKTYQDAKESFKRYLKNSLKEEIQQCSQEEKEECRKIIQNLFADRSKWVT